MFGQMLRLANYFEIFWTVVSFKSVFVVNGFIFHRFNSVFCYCNKPVNTHRLPTVFILTSSVVPLLVPFSIYVERCWIVS